MNLASAVVADDTLTLTCLAIRHETPSCKSYIFGLPEGRDIAFTAGQYLTLRFMIAGEEHLRSYTISSAPTEARRLAITVKRVAGGLVSNWLFEQFQIGQSITVQGHAGAFTADPAAAAPLVLITAGSGITPAAAILRDMVARGIDRPVTLLHFASSAAEMIFHAEMAHWARSLPRCHIIPVVTRAAPYSGWIGVSGRPSRDLLAGLLPALHNAEVMCCGPAPFMRAVAEITKALGLSPEHFLTESFEGEMEEATDLTTAAAAPEGHMLTFAKSGKAQHCAIDQSVLKAAKAADLRIQSSCGKGLCGTCRVKLLSGTVEMSHQGGIRPREIDQGYILACCSRPTSDLVIDR